MAQVVFNEERCKGCELCTIVCPVKIVIMQEKYNKRGFSPAGVSDMSKCIGCAACARICPDVVITVQK
ncbi:MAG: 4Fe-4S binding protein [Firmicutes bacterium]|nr:4Fe-4S binding protein [Dethiobacter sp.]MBS3889322.1 4Fe-4S binding protein [Bacillota bacterium]MBS4055005.1 4Fe-4S binding protein [Thermaerobacter sp.]